ncbi:MAG: hypothetical protein AB1384_04485 [Actinomycetota bacterium]
MSTAACVIAAIAVLLATWGGYAMAAEEVTTEELINDMPAYDGKEVTITGEAIGDVMLRDGYGWVTVNDDIYATRSIEEGGELSGYSNIGIAVWASRGDLEQIEVLGGYKNKGDRVSVTGVFNRACPEHGGDTDIHATSLQVLEQGYPFSHPFAWWKLVLVLALAAAALVLGSIWRKRVISSLSPARRR